MISRCTSRSAPVSVAKMVSEFTMPGSLAFRWALSRSCQRARPRRQSLPADGGMPCSAAPRRRASSLVRDEPMCGGEGGGLSPGVGGRVFDEGLVIPWDGPGSVASTTPPLGGEGRGGARSCVVEQCGDQVRVGGGSFHRRLSTTMPGKGDEPLDDADCDPPRTQRPQFLERATFDGLAEEEQHGDVPG